MLVKHIKIVVNALCVVFMQQTVAIHHNALSVRERTLSRNRDSSYSTSFFLGLVATKNQVTEINETKQNNLRPKKKEPISRFRARHFLAAH